ncbi:MAG: biotin synthase BioB [Actinobacteria bacterium]|jgi:biotin synthase|nr:biotin synthase BioB [Actinomycetota bacterium]
MNNFTSNSHARTLLREAETALLDEKRDLTPEELADLAALPDEHVAGLAAIAHEVRVDRCGLEVELEGILSAKTGGCTEDCSFCSQSARYDSPVKATPFLDMDEVRKAAQSTASLGASKFCLVLAVKGPDPRTLARILEAVAMVREETGLQVAVSAGLLDDDQAEQLAQAGVHCYNHNIETARSFFPNIVTSHTWEERVETCMRIKAHGMDLCSGVLLGMGETDEQRLEMLLQLRDLGPDDVPINFLNPRPGTPLGIRSKVPAWDALRWIAIFRLGLPAAVLRYAGGREVTLRELQAMGLAGGINALIVGNYLTTLGRDATDDIAMLQDMAMPVGIIGSAI